MAEEPLTDVFRLTVRSTTLITKPLTFDAVAEALITAYGTQNFHGIIINHQGKAVEIAFATNDCVSHILTHPLHIHDQPPIEFTPSFADTFMLTFYNVPLNSTGAGETNLIEAAGAIVINSTTITRRVRDADIRTGERRFLCSGKSRFTYLPTVVKLYSGRMLGCRYRGQAHDLATKIPPSDPGSSALAESSHWAAGRSSRLQPVQPRIRTNSIAPMEVSQPDEVVVQLPPAEIPPPDAVVHLQSEIAAVPEPIVEDPLPDAAAVTEPIAEDPLLVAAAVTAPIVNVPPPVAEEPSLSAAAAVTDVSTAFSFQPPSTCTSHFVSGAKPKDIAQSDTDQRSRSPRSKATSHESPSPLMLRKDPAAISYRVYDKAFCSHQCPDCSDVFTSRKPYINHCNTVHPVQHSLRRALWLKLKRYDSELFRRQMDKMTCSDCEYIYYKTVTGPLLEHLNTLPD